MTRSRRPAPLLVCLGTCVCLTVAGLRAAEAPAKPDATIRTVVITGGHGYDRNVFPRLFASAKDLACTLREGQAKGGKHLFDDVGNFPYDVIVLYNFNRKLTKARRESFLKLLDRGVGLVILHHAIVAYPQWEEFERIVGAKYYLRPTKVGGVEHPASVWKHGVDIAVHVADAAHPVTKGLKDFVLHDETYAKWTYHGAGRGLLTTDCPLNNKELAWAKTFRKSRVFFFQLGHGPQAFTDANYQRVVAQAIRWTARRIGKKDPSEKPKK